MKGKKKEIGLFFSRTVNLAQLLPLPWSFWASLQVKKSRQAANRAWARRGAASSKAVRVTSDALQSVDSSDAAP